MPEDRYPKDNILQVPVLKPERRYYSEGVLTGNDYYLVPTEPNQFFKTIDDLDGVYEMANLLPPDLAEIIQRVTNILSIDSQGKLILRMENEKEQPSQPDNNEPGKEEEPEDNQRDVTPSPDPEEEEDDGLFSRKPAFTITVEPSVSLVDLAHSSYEQDDLDIKNDYIQKMNSISSRYFSIMTTLAIEAGMPDYSYLLQDFDGTAVTTSDPNQQHLIDLICKQQILYDQKLRQMNLIHTAENTLIMTRGMTAAEGQRERYLDEKYKENLPDNASAMSNDLLQKSREEADKRYQDSAYNMYKYLDSATKFTNALLNLKIDEAQAKAQLVNTGSDIYAYTPPPQPTANDIDDNFETSIKAEEKGQKFVDEQKKDSVSGKEASNGSSSVSGNGRSSGGRVGSHPTKLGTGMIDIGGCDCSEDTLKLSYSVAEEVSKRTGIPADWIWGQMAHETGGFSSELAALGNWAGIKGGGSTDSLGHTQYGASGSEQFISIYSATLNNEPGMANAKTIDDFATSCKQGGYFEADLSEYQAALHRWVPTPTTIS